MLDSDVRFTCSGVMAFRPEPHGLWSARCKMRSLANDLCMDADETYQFLLAVGEAISNAYSHGTPDPEVNFIYLSWTLIGATLTVVVKDEGHGFLPECSESRASRHPSERGHGIGIMRSSVDRVEFMFDNGTNVMLTKYLNSSIRQKHQRMPSYSTYEPEVFENNRAR